MKKEYRTGNLVVTWEPGKCIHSGNCVKGLSAVFKPKEKPWIQVNGASKAEIIEQIKQCPSAALGYYTDTV